MLALIGAVLACCGEAATAKMEVPLRTGPATDREVVLLIPKGSTVKLGQCAHGWCKVSWQGQNGYVLAKNFAVAGLQNGSETDPDVNKFKQDDEAEDDE